MEIEYDERGNIKRLKFVGEEDKRNFQDAKTLVEYGWQATVWREVLIALESSR